MNVKAQSYDFDREDLERRISEWFTSEEAQISLRQAAEEANLRIAQVRREQRVTWQQMNTPIGPLHGSWRVQNSF